MEFTAARQKILTPMKGSDSRLEMKFSQFLNYKTILEQCTKEKLENLYKAYVELPDRKMTRSQLHEAFTKILKLSLSTDEFEELYRKMNSMRDECIKWDDLLSYLILEFRMKEITISTSQIFELPLKKIPKMIKSRHRSFICRIIFSPVILMSRIQNLALMAHQGCFITASRDGILNFWSTDFNHQRRIEKNKLQLQGRSMITDIAAMPDVRMLCVSSTERNLRFFEIAANKFELRMEIYRFKYCIIRMNYYYSTGNFKQHSCIAMGDTSGSVKLIIFNPIDRDPFKLRVDQNNLRFHYDTVLKNEVRGLKLHELHHIHSNWVSQISYYGSFHGFISCSRCPKCSLLFSDPTGAKFRYSFSVSMGITCFILNEEKQLLFTGGPDCLVRIWNLFVTKRATAILHGHRTTICAIAMLNNSGKLLTLSKDRCIKIWEITSRVCIQTYNRLPSELSDHTPMSMVYNSAMQKLIIGSKMVAILTCGKIVDDEATDGETHSRQITCVIYNPLFKVIVTTGADSRIIVWDPWRARRLDVISNAHGDSSYLNENDHIEITAAALDYSCQLLITGGRDGTLKIWSFSTGITIKNMKIENKCEITGIIWLENRILCAGLDGNITEFADIDTGVYRKSWKKRHSDDISCAAVRSQTLATGSRNGELVLWHLEMGQPYKLFNVMDPVDKDNCNRHIEEKVKTVGWRDDSENPYHDQSVLGLVRPVAVLAILFLHSRKIGPTIGTLIVSLSSGLIQLWSHHSSGGFIEAFSVNHINQDCCLSLTTDLVNDYLITGHKMGYIKVWLMKNYGLPLNMHSKINMASLRLQFPFLWKDRILRRAKRAVKNQPLPMLLSCIKGHLEAINTIEFISGANLILSGSSDHTVRLWTLSGRYISTLGSFRDWKTILPDVPVEDYFEDYGIPPDIKKNASSTTIRVLMGGFPLTKTGQNYEKEQSKISNDNNGNSYCLYGERVDATIVEDDKFKTAAQLQDNPILNNSMEYIPVYTHLKTFDLSTVD